MPDSANSGINELYERVDDLFRSEAESERVLRERAEIRAYIEDYERHRDEIRDAMTEAELEEEASIIAEQAECRARAERRRMAFEADLAAAAKRRERRRRSTQPRLDPPPPNSQPK